MTQDAENDAVWTLVKDEFTAEAKTYEYKATANGNWDDYVLPADKNADYNFDTANLGAGKYKLTFTVDTRKHSVNLDVEKLDVTTYTATFEANPPESIDNVSTHFTISLFANSQILVEGATGYPIVVYDLMGRQIARVPAAKFTELLCLPHRGVYLVIVSTLPVQKIINM